MIKRQRKHLQAYNNKSDAFKTIKQFLIVYVYVVEMLFATMHQKTTADFSILFTEDK